MTSSIWWAIAKASDSELSAFVDDLKNHVTVFPFVDAQGTDEDGCFTDNEFLNYIKNFAMQVMREEAVVRG